MPGQKWQLFFISNPYAGQCWFLALFKLFYSSEESLKAFFPYVHVHVYMLLRDHIFKQTVTKREPNTFQKSLIQPFYSFTFLRVLNVERARVVGDEWSVLEQPRGRLWHLDLSLPGQVGLVHPGGADGGGQTLDEALERLKMNDFKGGKKELFLVFRNWLRVGMPMRTK